MCSMVVPMHKPIRTITRILAWVILPVSYSNALFLPAPLSTASRSKLVLVLVIRMSIYHRVRQNSFFRVELLTSTWCCFALSVQILFRSSCRSFTQFWPSLLKLTPLSRNQMSNTAIRKVNLLAILRSTTQR